MSDKPLIETNPYLADPEMRKLMLEQVLQQDKEARRSGLDGGYIVSK